MQILETKSKDKRKKILNKNMQRTGSINCNGKCKKKKKEKKPTWFNVRFYKGMALLSELNNSEDKICAQFLESTFEIFGRRLGRVSETIFTTPNQN